MACRPCPCPGSERVAAARGFCCSNVAGKRPGLPLCTPQISALLILQSGGCQHRVHHHHRQTAGQMERGQGIAHPNRSKCQIPRLEGLIMMLYIYIYIAPRGFLQKKPPNLFACPPDNGAPVACGETAAARAAPPPRLTFLRKKPAFLQRAAAAVTERAVASSGEMGVGGGGGCSTIAFYRFRSGGEGLASLAVSLYGRGLIARHAEREGRVPNPLPLCRWPDSHVSTRARVAVCLSPPPRSEIGPVGSSLRSPKKPLGQRRFTLFLLQTKVHENINSLALKDDIYAML